MQPPNGRPRYRALVALGLLLIFVVLIVSAYLRLEAAGLGCVEWPTCYGQLARLELRGGGMANLIHRIAASSLGLLALVYLFLALRSTRHVIAALALIALVGVLAWVGRRTPAPLTPWVTFVNVAGGMAVVAILGHLLWARRGRRSITALRSAAAGGVAIACLVIGLGAWASANFSATACRTLACPAEKARPAEAFDPHRRLAVQDGRIVVDDQAALIQRLHRLGALLAFLYIGALGIAAWRLGHRRPALALLGLVGLETALGLGMARFPDSLYAAVAHNGAAALLLLGILALFHAPDETR